MNKKFLFYTGHSIKLLVAAISFTPLIARPVTSKTTITAENVRQVTRDLTRQEQKSLEKFLKDKIRSATNAASREFFEELIHNHYKGLFDLVLEELKSLGENPQSILKVTGLREDLLLGKLPSAPWFIQTIASLPAQEFLSCKDKQVYLESLLDAFRRTNRPLNQSQALDALFMLSNEFYSCKDDLPSVFLSRLVENLEEIESLIIYYQNQN